MDHQNEPPSYFATETPDIFHAPLTHSEKYRKNKSLDYNDFPFYDPYNRFCHELQQQYTIIDSLKQSDSRLRRLSDAQENLLAHRIVRQQWILLGVWNPQWDEALIGHYWQWKWHKDWEPPSLRWCPWYQYTYEVAEHRIKCERLSQNEQTRIDSHLIVREQWKKDGLWDDSWGSTPGWRWPSEPPLPTPDLESIINNTLAITDPSDTPQRKNMARKEAKRKGKKRHEPQGGGKVLGNSGVRKNITPKDSKTRKGSDGVQNQKPRRSPRFSNPS